MTISSAVAKAVWDRAEGLCEGIRDGARCYSSVQLGKHHIIQRGMGGRKGRAKKESDSMENLQLLCERCHRESLLLR